MIKIKRNRKEDYLCISLFPFALFTSPNAQPDQATWAVDKKTIDKMVSSAEERAFKRVYGTSKIVCNTYYIKKEEVDAYRKEKKVSEDRALYALLPKDAKSKLVNGVTKNLRFSIEKKNSDDSSYTVIYSTRFIGL